MYPSRKEAEKLLQDAEALNPGPWENHSRVAAHCAEKIAMQCDGLNPEKAYILELLHDIGRRFGVRHLGHASDGYAYMMALKFDEVARVCLSRSFNNQTLEDYVGAIDTIEDELDMIRNGFAERVYDDYDRLIQLCDSIAGAEGVVDMEERMSDVKRRYGSYPQSKWDTNIALKRYFKDKIGHNLYDVVKKRVFSLATNNLDILTALGKPGAAYFLQQQRVGQSKKRTRTDYISRRLGRGSENGQQPLTRQDCKMR